ncbi:MAG TPA: potassium-transporting ATPase subunit KdpA, partial [Myxococcota bacterium]|nr:potassium-transporting ATPase subunit KdpA [Myxococcota bacterium]
DRLLHRLAGVTPDAPMGWMAWAQAALAFNLVGALLVYLAQRAQGWLPLNPNGLGAVDPFVAFNAAISFATNTNWQAYGGETTMSHLTQMAALTVQNFLSAATGLAVMAALARGLVGRETRSLGSFWTDVIRSTVYVLLPLATVWGLLLVVGGVPQTLQGALHVTTLEGAEQTVAVGPVAAQVAIKQLGTNGGGYFNVNSAHPLENPSPFTNLLEVVGILLLPAAQALTFGRLVGDRRQGWMLLGVMTALLLPFLALTLGAEHAPGGWLPDGVAAHDLLGHDGGNLEGKEVRFGVAASAIWAVFTTAASNGSVNAMHDSFTALGGLGPMLLMQLGEVVFGGVGSGLYGMVVFEVVAVFVAGLMVGRTPELLGKTIGAAEIKMAALAILLPSVMVLVGAALAVATDAGRAGVLNPGPHGFSEVLYALSSGANNNGSAFGGLTANTPFWTLLVGAAMIVGRYGVLVPVLAMAGALASKRPVPVGPGTLPTATPLFGALLAGTVILVGALTFVPALALGPVVEHLLASGAP